MMSRSLVSVAIKKYLFEDSDLRAPARAYAKKIVLKK
jgi:hypothetical protein